MKTLSLFLCGALLLVSTACNKSSGLRHDVRGTVTWKGKPIPGGVITFVPDGTKGTRGPQGFAYIRNGKFDTRENGKGVVKGSLIISIGATDGKGFGEFHHGKPLFTSSVVQNKDVTAEAEELQLVIPENVALAKDMTF